MSPSGSPRARWRKTDLVDETPRLARSGETALRINRKSGAGGQSGSRAVGQPYEAGPTWALCPQIKVAYPSLESSKQSDNSVQSI